MSGKGIRIGKEEIEHITLFEGITRATVRDCVLDEKRDRVILVVKKGHMGLAIGHHGSNLKKLQSMTGKQYEVVEHSDDPVTFLKGILRPVEPREIRILENSPKGKIATIIVGPKDRAITIGRRGKNIEKISLLTRRYFGIDKVRVIAS
ncbi:MAG: NusA-like transcription termination signal-binding factor [Candidatus Bathyarchaeia archaeon]